MKSKLFGVFFIAKYSVEFKCTGEEKLYFSPIVNLCNSEVVAYGIYKRPILDSVIKPLEESVGILKENGTVRPTIHSDQGWQYQHKKRDKILKKIAFFRVCLATRSLQIMPQWKISLVS